MQSILINNLGILYDIDKLISEVENLPYEPKYTKEYCTLYYADDVEEYSTDESKFKYLKQEAIHFLNKLRNFEFLENLLKYKLRFLKDGSRLTKSRHILYDINDRNDYAEFDNNFYYITTVIEVINNQIGLTNLKHNLSF